MEWHWSDGEDGDGHSDAGGSSKWPYANALATLTSDDFLCTQKLPRQVKPPTISMGDSTFGWPLTKAQAQKLETLHGANAVIPAPELHVPDFDGWWATISDIVLASARQVLDIQEAAAVGVTLSHLVIDGSGSGDVLKAQATTPNTFGSVIVVLPSARKGGAITFTHGDTAQRFDAPPSATLMHVAVTYLQTTITSARLASGCRYALVLNLVDLDGPRSPMPPAMLRAIDAFKTLATRPTHEHRRIACELKPINHKLLWEKLGRKNQYLVDVLLATGAYDVVLVGFKKERDYDAESPYDRGNEEGWDYDKPRYKLINTVGRVTEHPACPIPAAMHPVLTTRGAHAFVGMEGRLEDVAIPATSVFFWPKQFRAEFFGVQRALEILEKAINDPAADLLGYTSVHDLAQSTIAIFGCGSLEQAIPTVEPLFAFAVRPTVTSFATTMGALLVQLNDVDLVMSFLRDAVTITPNTPLDVVAPVVHTLLSTFGWMRLADAMLGLVQRWVCSASASLLQLLASLAGVSTQLSVLVGIRVQPVCAALRQPCFGEFLKAAWSTLVHHDPLQFDYNGSSARTAILCDLLLLGEHVERSIPEDPRDNWLGAHLPPTLLSIVDDYLHPRRSALAALQDNMYKGNPAALLAHLPKALLNAVAKRPEMQLAPFADVLLATFDATQSATRPTTFDAALRCTDAETLRFVMGPRSFASLLVVLDATNRCTAAFVSLLWSKWGISTSRDLAPSRDLARTYVCTPMSVSPALLALVAAHFVDVAPALALLTNGMSDERQGILERNTSMELSWLAPTAKALLVLATMAPNAIPAFTAAWLAALPTTIDATLKRLYRLVVWTGQQLGPFYGNALVPLTTECLVRLRAARAPVAVVPTHEMTDIAIDPEHCYECRDVDAFLRDGTRAHLDLKLASWRLCSTVRECVAAHPDRLTITKSGDPKIEGILKLPPPAGVSLTEYTRTQNDQANIERGIATLESTLGDATQPAAKRQRHYLSLYA